MTKQELYRKVDILRQQIGIAPSLPYDSRVLCKTAFRLNLDTLDLKTSKLRGMSHIPSRSVVIDGKRSDEEQNFYCMHEIMHHIFHKGRPTKSYSSYEVTQADQDPFVEWQANEGAAQFLVPYQTFIPDYLHISRKYARDSFSRITIFEVLAEKYFVSPKVISNRVDSLNYEIYQALHGIDVLKVDIRSKYYLAQKNWNLKHEKTFCIKCLEPIMQNYRFCPICGKPVDDGHSLHRFGMVNIGVGYMIHSGIRLKEDGRVEECPICKNEEQLEGALFCMVCGNTTINQCTDALEYVPDYGHCSHIESLPGNARYCPYCGSQTTFFQNKLLLPWKPSKNQTLESGKDYIDDDDLPF